MECGESEPEQDKEGAHMEWCLGKGCKAQVGDEEIGAGEELAVELGNWLQTGKLVK